MGDMGRARVLGGHKLLDGAAGVSRTSASTPLRSRNWVRSRSHSELERRCSGGMGGMKGFSGDVEGDRSSFPFFFDFGGGLVLDVSVADVDVCWGWGCGYKCPRRRRRSGIAESNGMVVKPDVIVVEVETADDGMSCMRSYFEGSSRLPIFLILPPSLFLPPHNQAKLNGFLNQARFWFCGPVFFPLLLSSGFTASRLLHRSKTLSWKLTKYTSTHHVTPSAKIAVKKNFPYKGKGGKTKSKPRPVWPPCSVVECKLDADMVGADGRVAVCDCVGEWERLIVSERVSRIILRGECVGWDFVEDMERAS